MNGHIFKGRSLWPPHDKTIKMDVCPANDSDQPGHPPSQIRVFPVRMKKPWVLTQLAFYVNLHRAVIGPSATLTGRWRPDIDLRRMLTGLVIHWAHSKTLVRLSGRTGWSESPLGATSILLVFMRWLNFAFVFQTSEILYKERRPLLRVAINSKASYTREEKSCPYATCGQRRPRPACTLV